MRNTFYGCLLALLLLCLGGPYAGGTSFVGLAAMSFVILAFGISRDVNRKPDNEDEK